MRIGPSKLAAPLALLLAAATGANALGQCDPDRLREALIAYLGRGATFLKPGDFVFSSAGKNRSGTVETELGTASFITDQGPRTVKTSNNQDNVLTGVTPDGRVIHFLADGVSTDHGGATASSTLASTVRAVVTAGRTLRDAFDAFIPALQREARSDPRLAQMSSTALGIEISPNGEAAVVHAGDVRLVQLRGERILHETKDHNRAQEDVDAGKLTPESRLKSPLNRMLTKNYKIGDGFEEIGVRPTSTVIDLERGDLIIAASDGLFGVMTTEQMRAIVLSMHAQGRKPTTAEIAARLREEAHARVRQGFEPDNITILVYRHSADGF
jgi:serine/threonine protein phosphatase PrpC